jgi:SAM-dependent methyltransferase
MTTSYVPSRYWEARSRRRKADPETQRAQYAELDQPKHSLSRDLIYRTDHRKRLRQSFERFGWQNALDAGCGPGFWLQLWQQLGIKVTAVDLAPSAVAQARRMATNLEMDVEISQEDLTSLPFHNNSFDVAIAVKVLQHAPPDTVGSVIQELARVATDVLLLDFYSLQPVETAAHVFNHCYHNLLLQQGLTIRQSQVDHEHQWCIVASNT